MQGCCTDVDTLRAAQAERKIPMNYASRYRNTALSRQSYLPFKVNATGVMPVIFSSTLLSLPTGLSRYLPWLEPVAAALGPPACSTCRCGPGCTGRAPAKS